MCASPASSRAPLWLCHEGASNNKTRVCDEREMGVSGTAVSASPAPSELSAPRCAPPAPSASPAPRCAPPAPCGLLRRRDVRLRRRPRLRRHVRLRRIGVRLRRLHVPLRRLHVRLRRRPRLRRPSGAVMCAAMCASGASGALRVSSAAMRPSFSAL